VVVSAAVFQIRFHMNHGLKHQKRDSQHAVHESVSMWSFKVEPWSKGILCHAIVLSGRKSASRAGCWPVCYWACAEIGLRPAGCRPEGRFRFFPVERDGEERREREREVEKERG
jgi:hypothetical protein